MQIIFVLVIDLNQNGDLSFEDIHIHVHRPLVAHECVNHLFLEYSFKLSCLDAALGIYFVPWANQDNLVLVTASDLFL